MNPNQQYAGANQTSDIEVPATIGYKYLDWEDGPWAMLPYADLYPPPPPQPFPPPHYVPPPIYRTGPLASHAASPKGFSVQSRDGTVAWLPPPVQTTDMWSANQKWPL